MRTMLPGAVHALRRGRRGTAAVEFAIVLPLLLILVMGILEVGRMLDVQQIMTNAVREGARHGAADAPIADVEQVVRRYLIQQGLTAAEASATVTCKTDGTTASGFPVYQVRVSLPISAAQWVSSPVVTSPGSQLIAEASWTRNN